MCVQGIPWQWPSGWDSVLLVPGGAGSILVPGRGTEILLAAYCGQKKKKAPKERVFKLHYCCLYSPAKLSPGQVS